MEMESEQQFEAKLFINITGAAPEVWWLKKKKRKEMSCKNDWGCIKLCSLVKKNALGETMVSAGW